MKKLLVFILMLSIVQMAHATYVRGHYRKDGTYVNGHYRSQPNWTKTDNYSTKGNRNPYTGKRGTASPYRTNPYRNHRRNYGGF